MKQTIETSAVFGYKLTTNVVYAHGKTGPADTRDITLKDLVLDVYEPLNERSHPRPAVILIHGGAFHRGARRSLPFQEQGATHSMMEDWARLLTPLGYVCFVIDYRLVPDNPVTDIDAEAEGMQDYRKAYTEAGLERTNLVRRAMQLAEVSDTDEDKLMLWRGVLAAMEDANKAVSFVCNNAQKYNVDPDRIAIGGHSAGAATTLNTAYGLKAPVKAIFPMSPPVIGYDMGQVIGGLEQPPPMLQLLSQNDEPAVAETTPPLIEVLKKEGVDYEFAWVPGYGHFYPSGAVSLADDGTRMSVGERVERFLGKHLRSSESR